MLTLRLMPTCVVMQQGAVIPLRYVHMCIYRSYQGVHASCMQQLHICCPEDWIQPCPVHGTIHLKAYLLVWLSDGGTGTVQHVGVL